MRINFLEPMCTRGRGLGFVLTRLGAQLYLMTRLPTLTHPSFPLLTFQGQCWPKGLWGEVQRPKRSNCQKNLPLTFSNLLATFSLLRYKPQRTGMGIRTQICFFFYFAVLSNSSPLSFASSELNDRLLHKRLLMQLI